MRALIIIAIAVASIMACVDRNVTPPGSDKFSINSSKIDRSRSDSDMIETYTPGSQEALIYDTSTGETSRIAVEPGFIREPQGELANDTPSEFVGISCSSGDKLKD